MNKVILFFFSLLFTSAVFANGFVLNNQLANPPSNKKFRIAIQWASSAKEVKKYNIAIKHGEKLNPRSLQMLAGLGKVNIATPKNMEYFRVLVWSKGKGEQPDLLTNWVDIISNKTYTLNENQLTSLALMAGMGC